MLEQRMPKEGNECKVTCVTYTNSTYEGQLNIEKEQNNCSCCEDEEPWLAVHRQDNTMCKIYVLMWSYISHKAKLLLRVSSISTRESKIQKWKSIIKQILFGSAGQSILFTFFWRQNRELKIKFTEMLKLTSNL